MIVDLQTVERFDPGDVEALFAQDAIYEEYGWFPPIPAGWSFRNGVECRWPDRQLAAFVRDLRNAILLPVHDDIITGMRCLLETAEAEANVRRAKAEKRAVAARKYGVEDWATYDLIGAVRASCGVEGRLSGGQWWFHCPYGHSTGKSPSLHVDAENRTWFCFGCQRGGGVVEWKKANERT